MRARFQNDCVSVGSLPKSYQIDLLKQGVYVISELESRLYDECFGLLMDGDGSCVRAGKIIPALEDSGEIHLLDQRVLMSVIADLDGDPRALNGCNISLSSLLRDDFWDFLQTVMSTYADLASRLVIEITETTPYFNSELAAIRLKELRRMGCKTALDDFGAGYATPRILLGVEFDIVKIDASFVSDIRGADRPLNSLRHLVGFASCFSPAVVVEGIETRAQLEEATDAGASHAQGFLLSRPTRRGPALVVG